MEELKTYWSPIRDDLYQYVMSSNTTSVIGIVNFITLPQEKWETEPQRKWFWEVRTMSKYRGPDLKPLRHYAESLEDAKQIVEFLSRKLVLDTCLLV